MVDRDSLAPIIEEKLDLTPLREGRIYAIGPSPVGQQIIPRAIKTEAARDLYNYLDEKVCDPDSRKERGKLQFLEAVFGKDGGRRSNPPLESCIGALYKPNRKKLLGGLKGANKPQRKIHQFLNNPQNKKLLESVLLADVKDLVISKQQSGKLEELNEAFESLMLVLSKYNPAIYEKMTGIELLYPSSTSNILENLDEILWRKIYSWGDFTDRSVEALASSLALSYRAFTAFPKTFRSFLNLAGISGRNTLKFPLIAPNPSKDESEEKQSFYFKHSYELQAVSNPQLLRRAALATGSSCIREGNEEGFRKRLSDSGAIYVAGSEDGELKGYSRIFVTLDEEDKPVLAIDAIEPPAKNFERNTGLINAFCLGAIQLCFDMGAKYVVSNDSRINYGPREAFGNKEKRFKLRKLGGSPRTSYTMSFNGEEAIYEGSPYILMDNWRIN